MWKCQIENRDFRFRHTFFPTHFPCAMLRSRPLCPGQQIPPAVWGGSVRGSPRRRCPWPKPRAEGVAPQPSAFSFYYTSQHLGFSFYILHIWFFFLQIHTSQHQQEPRAVEHALFTHSPVHVHIHIRNPQTYPAPCTGLSVTHSPLLEQQRSTGTHASTRQPCGRGREGSAVPYL